MDFDSLRSFEAAATTLNFRAAADRVHLSPAAFSDRIQRLEEWLLAPPLPAPTTQAGAGRASPLLGVSPPLPLFRYFLDALPDAEPWPFAHVESLGGIGNIRLRLLDGGDRVAVLPRYFIRADLAARRLVKLLPRVPLRS